MSKGSWARAHGHKIQHNHWIKAWWHAFELRRKSGEALEPYACYWTDEGNGGARKHWHVGHTVGTGFDRRMEKAPRPQYDTYNLQVRLTDAEHAKLTELAGDVPVMQYASRVILAQARTQVICCHVQPDMCILETSSNVWHAINAARR